MSNKLPQNFTQLICNLNVAQPIMKNKFLQQTAMVEISFDWNGYGVKTLQCLWYVPTLCVNGSMLHIHHLFHNQ